ncbi:MAG: YceI family protein [Pseudonocardiaceae bacterium]
MVNTSPKKQRVDLPTAGRYRLDPARSSVAFRTRHLFGLAGVAGTMQVAAGEIVVDPASKSSVTVTVSASSFSTGNDRRDGDVRKAKFLNVEEYPEFTFRAGRLDQDQGRWSLTGELAVRGVSKPVTLDLDSVEVTGQGFHARATTRIDRYAFGVTAAKGMAARFLDVDVTVVAEPV